MRRLGRRPSVEKRMSFDLDGREISLTLRMSGRARRVRLEVSARRGVTLVVPHTVPQTVALRFLGEKKDWLRKRLEKLEARARAVESDFSNPPRLLYLGKRVSVKVELRARIARPRVRYEEDRLVLVWPTRGEPSKSVLVQAFEAFYRKEASRHLVRIQRQTAREMGLSVGRPTIRGQKTVWGSYSPKGRVSLNWKLMMTPPEAIRYVIVHELSHALVKDHSPRFWRRVAAVCPDYEKWRRWLDEHADLIQRLATFEHLVVLVESGEVARREKTLRRA